MTLKHITSKQFTMINNKVVYKGSARYYPAIETTCTEEVLLSQSKPLLKSSALSISDNIRFEISPKKWKIQHQETAFIV